MKLFLAGVEGATSGVLTQQMQKDGPSFGLTSSRLPEVIRALTGGHSNYLLCYTTLRKGSSLSRIHEFLHLLQESVPDPECILMDSGAYPIQFGPESKHTHLRGLGHLGPRKNEYDFFRRLTEQYLEDLERLKWRGLYVEFDVQRVIGSDAVWKIREEFPGDPERCMRVWHSPDGPDGMQELARRYPFIGFSLIEVNVLLSLGISQSIANDRTGLESMARDLLRRAWQTAPKAPRVHLLGTTVQNLVTNPMAWSSDATVWIAGVRYGSGCYFDPYEETFSSVRVKTPRFQQVMRDYVRDNPLLRSYVLAQGRNPNTYQDVYCNAACASQVRRFQEWLDARVTSYYDRERRHGV